MIAGLDVLRIINEPTAAAIAYGLDKKTKGGCVGRKRAGCAAAPSKPCPRHTPGCRLPR